MAQFKEFEGKNVDAAVQAACREMKTSKDKLKYDVISYGSSGIFGLVQTKMAKIRVTVARGKKEAAAYRPDTVDEPAVAIPDTGSPPAEFENEVPEPGAGKADPTPTESPAATVAADNGDAIALGTEILGKILDAITEEARISVEEDDGRILFNVAGGNSAILIGKRGQTLEAIQYIVEKAVNKNNEERTRVQVDVEGYLKNRRDTLRSTAEKMAEKSKRTGKPITLGQMSAYDRRIVHLALKEDAEVRTQSQGDGFYRKLVIFPKRGAAQKRRGREPEGAGPDLSES